MMTSDTGEMVRYWAHRQMAKEHFHNHRLMYATAFEEVAWWQVYSTLRGLLRLFSLWAGKQMMNIAVKTRIWQKGTGGKNKNA